MSASPLALALAAALAAGAAAPAAPYTPEERMDFSIDYLGIPMGKARIAVGKPEDGIVPLLLQARTSGVAEFFEVREQIASVVDIATGLPRSFTLDALEGTYRHHDTTRFRREEGKATVREQGKYDNTKEIEVPPGALDFLAMVFRLRALSLEPGATHEFDVLAGTQVSHVRSEVVGRETVKTPAGQFPAVKVRVPTGFTGTFSEKDPTYVWFSDDARRIVVRLSTHFAIGRAQADLASYQPGRG
ncbi:MAG TPA: DUF3108 domain-containing protein [Anaeromyxobacter sp.]|nr:DUF3108 domain-containing protein [Anaeromyxobacter sp.]